MLCSLLLLSVPRVGRLPFPQKGPISPQRSMLRPSFRQGWLKILSQGLFYLALYAGSLFPQPLFSTSSLKGDTSFLKPLFHKPLLLQMLLESLCSLVGLEGSSLSNLYFNLLLTFFPHFLRSSFLVLFLGSLSQNLLNDVSYYFI